MMRRGDRSSVVLGKGLSTRDGKVVKVSAKKNTCIRTDQKSCEKSCEGTEMASASPPRCYYLKTNDPLRPLDVTT